MKSISFRLSAGVLALWILAACQTAPTVPPEVLAARQGMMERIRQEPPGDYFVGRRYYKRDYKFWGFVRQPGQPWSTAKLVMLNEQEKLAPDRTAGKLGADHGHEYRLYGRFTDDVVYEPASNRFYPEFVLRGFDLKDASPGPIFRTSEANDPTRRVIGQPF